MAAADIDHVALRRAVAEQALRVTPGIEDIETYWAAQNLDTGHRERLGPLLPAGGASGVVLVDGAEVARWGDPARPEMTFSVTKSVISLVAGLAFDDGLLHPDQPVSEVLDLPQFTGDPAARITWRHLLDQTSGWDGELWGKPATVDAQSGAWDASAPDEREPGRGWAYNDVRVNLLCLALTALLRRPLPEVLADRVLRPLGASTTWTWHGYRNSVLRLDAAVLPVVSGGGHWGGGLWISAADLALVGELYRTGGGGLISPEWIAASWTPSRIRADYGLLWWLNDGRTVFADAPATGRAARGNARRHLLWVDPALRLTIASHWCEDIGTLVAEVSAAVSAALS